MTDLGTAKYEIPEKRQEDEEKVSVTSYEPLGVAVAICPWNCASRPYADAAVSC